MHAYDGVGNSGAQLRWLDEAHRSERLQLTQRELEFERAPNEARRSKKKIFVSWPGQELRAQPFARIQKLSL